MSVQIQSINIKKMGPLSDFKQTLRKVNLFYGLNETGKTYLVEFLLRSLFRHAAAWDLREISGDGSIEVSGLNEDIVVFRPDQGRKIEDYWTERESGLPVNMARLLVVKGAQLDLAQGSPGGVNRAVLKSALTSQALLDEIWQNIQHTVRTAAVENGQIIGNNKGKIKDLYQLEEDLAGTANLLSEIEGSYSRGPARQVEIALQKVEREISRQEEAKRHLAYSYWSALDGKKSEKNQLDRGKIEAQRDRIRDYHRLEDDRRSLQERFQKQEKRSKDYLWLDAAVQTWEEKGLESKKAPSPLIGLGGLASLAAGVILLLLDAYSISRELFWYGAGMAGPGFLLTGYYGYRLHRWVQNLDDSRERKRVQEDTLARFNLEPNSLADLKVLRDQFQTEHAAAQNTRSLIEEKNMQLAAERAAIRQAFQDLLGEQVSESEWKLQVSKLSGDLDDLEAEIKELELKLGRLDVPEEEFQEEAPGDNFDPAILRQLVRDKNELESELSDLKAALETLKARACERTGDKITLPWPQVYLNLKDTFNRLSAEHKQLTAEIIAEIGLTQVLAQLREEEDKKIIQALNAQEISDLISSVTGKYHTVDLEDDQLFLQDDYSRYALQDLSTGVQEQVQLALRLGIAAQVSSSPLFMILDDAFQHSDWSRRESLVQKTLDLAAEGWQIIYLSMDDHIRDLYLKLAKPALKDEFQLVRMS